MAKINPAKSGFNQYKSGVNQYGAQGANANPENPNFQDLMSQSQAAGKGKKPSPMEMAQQINQQNFGPPQTQASQGQLAPENFGPPMINNDSSDLQNFGPPMGQSNSQSGASNSNGGGSNSNSTMQSGLTKADKKHSYKEVEQMEQRNMMQQAISEMHIKNPDPGAWSQ